MSQDMRNSGGVSKTQCADVAAGTWFYHTQNSNHLDQNINLNKYKLSLLVNANTAECNVSHHKNKTITKLSTTAL